ncbi:MAG: AmmeMemoRadiSam system protein B [Candidatus Riflebacteria bacterium]|nr:AmmeMemoRadiSam system protein B [Candidatus Riflebacteria bacterium]
MIREPIVSGRFYPDSRDELLDTIEACAKPPLGIGNRSIETRGRLEGLILPHAGYIFSGPAVTWGMKRLREEHPMPGRLLLLGPKHTALGAPVAISPATAWRTPLGNVPIDDELRSALLENHAMVSDAGAHTHEHSLEVQLPFLQVTYGETPFSMVPIAFHFATLDECRTLGTWIGTILNRPGFADVRVLVSSDFSHETPRQEAYRLDAEAIGLIERLDAEGFYRLVTEDDRSICGVIPITIFLFAVAAMKKSIKGSCLTYSTSMDVMPHPRGVGYAAIAFENTGSTAGTTV